MALPIHCVDGNDARPTATAGHGRGLLNEKQAADLLTVKLGTLRRGGGPEKVRASSNSVRQCVTISSTWTGSLQRDGAPPPRT